MSRGNLLQFTNELSKIVFVLTSTEEPNEMPR